MKFFIIFLIINFLIPGRELLAQCDISLESSITPSCSENPSGSIIINKVTGGKRPFIFRWSNGSTKRSLDKLEAGEYKLSISDADGCVHTQSFNIVYSDPILASIDIDQNSTRVINAGGKKLNFMLFTSGNQLISNKESTDRNTVLNQGEYYYLIVDNSGCSKRLDFLIE
ncbi:MAG: SprB repeat-containing protein [Bacteroidota bacterium]